MAFVMAAVGIYTFNVYNKNNIKYDMNTILWITDISETAAMLTFLKKKTSTQKFCK